MSNLWPFILLWSACPDSSTYWRPHLLHSIRQTILLVLHEACILMVNRLPVALLVRKLVVFNMGQVLQWLVLHGKLPGVLFARNVKVACTGKSFRFLGRLKAIIGGKLQIAFRKSELCKVILWCSVVRARKFMLHWWRRII